MESKCANCGAAPYADHEWYCVTKRREHGVLLRIHRILVRLNPEGEV